MTFTSAMDTPIGPFTAVVALLSAPRTLESCSTQLGQLSQSSGTGERGGFRRGLLAKRCLLTHESH